MPETAEEDLVAQPKFLDPPTRLIIHDLAKRDGYAHFADDVRRGLSANPKHLFPKYLYDELGSQLFKAICHVDEYYLTRAEDEILAQHANEIVASVPNCRTRRVGPDAGGRAGCQACRSDNGISMDWTRNVGGPGAAH